MSKTNTQAFTNLLSWVGPLELNEPKLSMPFEFATEAPAKAILCSEEYKEWIIKFTSVIKKICDNAKHLNCSLKFERDKTINIQIDLLIIINTIECPSKYQMYAQTYHDWWSFNVAPTLATFLAVEGAAREFAPLLPSLPAKGENKLSFADKTRKQNMSKPTTFDSHFCSQKFIQTINILHNSPPLKITSASGLFHMNRSAFWK